MNARSYKIIFILLGSCILFILLLQGYWIRNSYLQKTEAFNRLVYASLEQLTTKLQERKNLQALKMTYFIQNGDTIAKTPSRRMTILSEENTQIINGNKQNVSSKQIISLKNKNGKTIKDSIIIIGKNDKVNIILNGKKAHITVNNKAGNKSKQPDLIEDSQEITKLVDKMLTEIKVLDTEDNNVDSLENLVKKTLANKGLFLPFEFSIQKLNNGKKKVIAQSPGFTDEMPSYKSDLSANKIFSTHEFLFLQFPSQKDFVMAGMKASLLLSFIFSLLIISVFYYTMRLIFKQKKLSEIKNDFVNNMTHELKTPIATIALALDGISNPIIRNDPEKFNEYTRILKEENKKLDKHVERVLQMALLDKGELQLNKEKVNPALLIQNAINGYALQIQKQKASVRFISTEENVMIIADSLHLSSVFTNLLDNALKYCNNPCVITIELKKLNSGLHIVFKDNGIGIDAHLKERIFEKFYRVQGGNLHDVKGFGLGLSYVRSIIEAHGGSITLQSEKGKGTEFIIKLPCHAN